MDKDERKTRFQWRNRTQYVMFFLTYLMDWGLFNFLLYENPSLNPKYEPSLVHFLVVIIILGSPVLFFQTFIGEYSGRGCIFMGEMLPAAQGLGYAMLLISFGKFTYGLFYTVKIFSYLLATFINRTGPWMLCSNKFVPDSRKCFGNTDLDLCPTKKNSNKTCFEPKTRVLSAFLYKEYTAFMRFGSSISVSDKRRKLIVHSFHTLILLPLLLIFALKGIRSFAVSLRGSIIFCLGVSMSIMVVMIIRPGSETGLYILFRQINSKSLLDVHTWATTLRRVIQGLRLADGGHFLFGTYIPESAPELRRTIYLAIAFSCLAFFTMLYFSLFLGLLNFKLNMGIKALDLVKEEDAVFITFPLVLGIHASAYLFTVIYFLVAFLLSFHALILNVFMIEKTITLQFDIREYSFYIKIVLVVLATMLTYALELEPYYTMVEVVENELKRCQTCVLAMQILVLFMYGLQRMSDDMHFYTHSEVKTFTKVCWIATLFLCAGSFYVEITATPKVDFTIRMIVCGVICLPFVVFFFLKLFFYVWKKNIIGLLRPSDLYGPPELEKRVLRILYNPRLVIRCKGQLQICYHDCLLNGIALKKAVQEEMVLIQSLITDLQSTPSETIQADIISTLKMCENILLKALAKKDAN